MMGLIGEKHQNESAFYKYCSVIEKLTFDFLFFFQYLYQSLLDVTTFANDDLHDAIAKTLSEPINIGTYCIKRFLQSFFSNPIRSVFPRDFGN